MKKDKILIEKLNNNRNQIKLKYFQLKKILKKDKVIKLKSMEN